MSLADGLYPGEVVLLVLGVVLFVVLLFVLWHQVSNRRSLSGLLGFFMLPIAMIGYPSIRSLQYREGMITIEKTTQQLEANPSNPKLRATLQQQVQRTAPRSTNNPQDAVVVAKARSLLGDFSQPTKYDPKAFQMLNDAETYVKLQQLTEAVERNPADQTARAELQEWISKAEKLGWTNQNGVGNLGTNENGVALLNRARAALRQ